MAASASDIPSVTRQISKEDDAKWQNLANRFQGHLLANKKLPTHAEWAEFFEEQKLAFNELVADAKDVVVRMPDNEGEFKQVHSPKESAALSLYLNAFCDVRWVMATKDPSASSLTQKATSQIWGLMGQQFDQALSSTEMMVFAAIPIIYLYRSQGKQPPYEMLVRVLFGAAAAIIPWNSAIFLVFGSWSYTPTSWDIFLDPKLHAACALAGIFEAGTQYLTAKITVDSPLGQALKDKNLPRILEEFLSLPITIPQTILVDGFLSQEFWMSMLPVGLLSGAAWSYVFMLTTLAEWSPFYSALAVAGSVALCNSQVSQVNPQLNAKIRSKVPAEDFRAAISKHSPSEQKKGTWAASLYGFFTRCCASRPKRQDGESAYHSIADQSDVAPAAAAAQAKKGPSQV